MQLHWDGDNDSVDERNLSAGLGAGITPVTVDHAGAEARARLDLDAAAARRIPTRSTRRWPRAARRVYGSSAVDCHGDHRFRDGHQGGRPASARSRTSIGSAPIATGSIRTPPTFAANQYALFPGLALPLHAVPQDARLRQPPARRHLARAPYLHNGSVPTLRDLLDAPAERPAVVLSRLRRLRSGSASASSRTCRKPAAGASSATTRAMPGNGNSGHEYGTTLPDADKDAIVEYLKTF